MFIQAIKRIFHFMLMGAVTCLMITVLVFCLKGDVALLPVIAEGVVQAFAPGQTHEPFVPADEDESPPAHAAEPEATPEAATKEENIAEEDTPDFDEPDTSGELANGDAQAGQAPREPDASAGSADKVVALTFDDGPSERMPQIVRVLEEHEATGTFFIVGSMVGKKGGMIAEAYEKGFEIASHTYAHKKLSRLSQKEIRKEVTKTEDVLKEYCGQDTFLQRAPYGVIPEKVTSALERQWVQWDVDPQDWKEDQTPETIAQNVMDNVKDGSVILLHDHREHTIEALEKLIPRLKEEGYRFVTVSRLIEMERENGHEVPVVFYSGHGAGQM
ncbi:MAG: polysaccharide deacetylase family protein [Christensenellales bacterium]|jgi:peptidoglycan/xylan/chitin deacetylase (PgdA/CDA1 family)